MQAKTVHRANEARGSAAESGRGVARPRAWLGPSMNEYEPEDDSSGVECPTCGRDDFTSPRGMKTHHKLAHDESIAGVKVGCANCGREKRVAPSEADNRARFFCDDDCRSAWCAENWSGEDSPAWEGGGVFVECFQCGGEVEVPHWKFGQNERYFCDRKCETAWQSSHFSGENNPRWDGGVDVECAQCGAQLTVRRSVFEENERHFCNYGCMGEWESENQRGRDHPNWKGGKVPYGAGWNEAKREKIRQRQGRKCGGCGVHESETRRKLDVHHIQKARKSDDDEARNDDTILVALCESCHKVWERITPLRPQTPHLD